MNTIDILLNKISIAKELDFGDILSKSINLFKKTWLQGFIFFLIMLVIMIPLFAAIYIPMYQSIIQGIQNGNSNLDGRMFEADNYRFMMIGVSFLMGLLMVPVTTGFYRIINKIDFAEQYGFKDFFYFFKIKYFTKILIIVAISLIIAFLNFGLEKVLPKALATIISLVLSVAINIYFMLFIVFMAFNTELEGSNIINLGINLGTKKGLLILGLVIITGIIGFIGILGCGIGILFTFSIIYLPVYIIYKEVIGFSAISEIDQIGIE